MTLSHVKMQVSHIKLSINCSIWSYDTCAPCRSSGLNKILFSLRRFYHHWLSKKQLARESYCHWNRHCIVKFNIPAESPDPQISFSEHMNTRLLQPKLTMHIAKRCRETKTLVQRAQAEFLLMNLMTHVQESVSSS